MPVNLPSSPSGYKGSAKDNEIEKLRISKAFWLSVFGLGLAAVLVGFLVSMGWDTPTEIASVVGLFTSILGTLVGLFFGLQVGSAGKEKAEERADNAQKKAEALLLAAADIGLMDKARSLYPDLF
jgi:TRAP-type C4-dicarboxylate transport system permease large subunit